MERREKTQFTWKRYVDRGLYGSNDPLQEIVVAFHNWLRTSEGEAELRRACGTDNIQRVRVFEERPSFYSFALVERLPASVIARRVREAAEKLQREAERARKRDQAERDRFLASPEGLQFLKEKAAKEQKYREAKRALARGREKRGLPRKEPAPKDRKKQPRPSPPAAVKPSPSRNDLQ